MSSRRRLATHPNPSCAYTIVPRTQGCTYAAKWCVLFRSRAILCRPPPTLIVCRFSTDSHQMLHCMEDKSSCYSVRPAALTSASGERGGSTGAGEVAEEAAEDHGAQPAGDGDTASVRRTDGNRAVRPPRRLPKSHRASVESCSCRTVTRDGATGPCPGRVGTPARRRGRG